MFNPLLLKISFRRFRWVEAIVADSHHWTIPVPLNPLYKQLPIQPQHTHRIVIRMIFVLADQDHVAIGRRWLVGSIEPPFTLINTCADRALCTYSARNDG